MVAETLIHPQSCLKNGFPRGSKNHAELRPVNGVVFQLVQAFTVLSLRDELLTRNEVVFWSDSRGAFSVAAKRGALFLQEIRRDCKKIHWKCQGKLL